MPTSHFFRLDRPALLHQFSGIIFSRTLHPVAWPRRSQQTSEAAKAPLLGSSALPLWVANHALCRGARKRPNLATHARTPQLRGRGATPRAMLALCAVRPRPAYRPSRRTRLWMWGQSALLFLLTLFTPGVSAAEQVVDGQAFATYGPLFPLYMLHVAVYWGASLNCAITQRAKTRDDVTSDQLSLISAGLFLTGAIALLTNALIPYWWGIFAFAM